MKKVGISSILFVAIILLNASWSWAVLVDATIMNGSEGNIGFSGVHEATHSCSNNLCKSGTVILGFPNAYSTTLQFDFSSTGGFSLSVPAGPPSTTGPLTVPGQGSIEFTAGTVSDPGTGGTQFAGGSLDYTLTLNGQTPKTGTFYFVAQAFGGLGQGGPNNIDSNSFWIWGNNWDINGNPATKELAIAADPQFIPLGLDLRGTFTPVTGPVVPIPSAAILFGTGLLGLLGFARRKGLGDKS